jgi:hypothetical protein
VKVSGVLEGKGSGAKHDIAVAVDGKIVATAPTVEHRVFSVLLPKPAERVALYEIEPNGRLRLL